MVRGMLVVVAMTEWKRDQEGERLVWAEQCVCRARETVGQKKIDIKEEEVYLLGD